MRARTRSSDPLSGPSPAVYPFHSLPVARTAAAEMTPQQRESDLAGSDSGSASSQSFTLPPLPPVPSWVDRLSRLLNPQTPTKAWQTALSRVLFEPVGIPEDARFCWDERHRDDIAARNPSLRVRGQGFRRGSAPARRPAPNAMLRGCTLVTERASPPGVLQRRTPRWCSPECRGGRSL